MSARLYSIDLPRGMLAFGHTTKTFTSVFAFDGYVTTLRALGYTVVYASPFSARASRCEVAS